MSDDMSQSDNGEHRNIRTEGLNMMRKVMPGVFPEGDIDLRDGGFADELVEMGLISVWGQLWTREGLSPRDRSLITLALLISRNADVELRTHIKVALNNGVTKTEIAELIYHSAPYAGFPAAVAARCVARSVFDGAACASAKQD